ncbi:MAG: extracellular solute-binding protein [Bacillota bacterium]|nr:extracellular solute-binding protein [Bacillota bacterium]
MKKKWLSMLLAAMLVFCLAACGNEAEDPGTEEQDQEQAEEEVLEDTLVVYSTHSEEMLEAICSAFTEATGVETEYINLRGELADRVRSEKENPQADIMFGGDTATYMQLKSEDCFDVAEPEWGEALSDAYKDSEGYWFGTIKTPVMMFYNSELLSAEDAPADWSDLTGSEYQNLIVTRDSLSSSMRSAICGLIYSISEQEGEEAAWEYLQQLDANTKNYYNSGSMMYQAVGLGEAAISVAVLSDIVANRDNNGMPLEIIDAASGSVILTDCIAKIKNAPHPNAAEAFLEFAGSAEIQAMVANDFNRTPTLDEALADSPEWMQSEYRAMELDWAVISENQSDWLERWETDIIDSGKTISS